MAYQSALLQQSQFDASTFVYLEQVDDIQAAEYFNAAYRQLVVGDKIIQPTSAITRTVYVTNVSVNSVAVGPTPP